MAKPLLKYQNWFKARLKFLTDRSTFWGALAFSLIWLVGTFLLTVLLWFMASFLFPKDVDLNVAIILTTPHLILTGKLFFAASFVATECLWSFFGIYRILGIRGTPIRDKFLSA